MNIKQTRWDYECRDCGTKYSRYNSSLIPVAFCDCGGRWDSVGGIIAQDGPLPLFGEHSCDIIGPVLLTRDVKLGVKDGFQTAEPAGDVHMQFDIHVRVTDHPSTPWLECLGCGHRVGPCIQFLHNLHAGSSCPRCKVLPLYAADGKGDYRINRPGADRIVIDDPQCADLISDTEIAAAAKRFVKPQGTIECRGFVGSADAVAAILLRVGITPPWRYNPSAGRRVWWRR